MIVKRGAAFDPILQKTTYYDDDDDAKSWFKRIFDRM